MTEAEAKRQQQRRAWDAEHLRSIGTKLTPVELARLDAYCFRIRTTRYSLLRTLVLEELAAYERENRVTCQDGCCCLRSSESSPPSFVENSVDNTPVKGFASGLSATLDRRVAAQVSNERGLRL